MLSETEFKLRAALKKWVLGLAVIEHFRKRQASRMTNLKEGDANTHFFHLKPKSRRRKNHISRLQSIDRWVVTHQEKEQVVQNFFNNMLGPPPSRTKDFN